MRRYRVRAINGFKQPLFLNDTSTLTLGYPLSATTPRMLADCFSFGVLVGLRKKHPELADCAKLKEAIDIASSRAPHVNDPRERFAVVTGWPARKAGLKRRAPLTASWFGTVVHFKPPAWSPARLVGLAEVKEDHV